VGKPEASASPAYGDAHSPEEMAMWKVLRREDGQDLLEYGLLASLIAMFVMGALTMTGRTINDVLWRAIASARF
jgi:Flp pilus assembly pilin Flp